MKIALASDLHLEFGDIDLKNEDKAEVLILSGDIFIAQDLHDHPEPKIPYPSAILNTLGSRQRKAQEYRDFLKRCSFQFPHVVYVAGNHEFYNGKFPESLQDLRNECMKFDNVYFMENESRKINDFTFIGCTLWTNMNKGDPITLFSIKDKMNDYRIIRNSDRNYARLTPNDTMNHHIKSLSYIKQIVEDNPDEKFVVVGHMAPSKRSIHPKYARDEIVNGAYSSSLDEFILDHPQIKLWTHGHTHHSFDYMIGETRIVCNPRGYINYEEQASNFQLQFLEI